MEIQQHLLELGLCGLNHVVCYCSSLGGAWNQDSTCREVTKVQPGSLADQTLGERNEGGAGVAHERRQHRGLRPSVGAAGLG